MELGSYFFFLQEQIKDIIIPGPLLLLLPLLLNSLPSASLALAAFLLRSSWLWCEVI
jgi:hypothetical protein